MKKADGNYNHPCPLCGDHRGSVAISGRDHLLANGAIIDVIACYSCGLWRVDHTLDSEGLRSLYPDDYKPYYDDRPIKPVPVAKLSHRLRKWYFDWMSRNKPSLLHLPLKQMTKIFCSYLITYTEAYRFNPFAFVVEDKSVLDIGCADGHFLAEMEAMGWDASGVEFHPEAIKRAKGRGIQVYEGEFLQVADQIASERTFDLVTLRQVLEHFDDPFEVLRKANTLLRPGGFIAIWTPVTDGLASRYFKDSWYNLDIPRHRVLFSVKTLKAMLLQAGFAVSYYSNISSTDSLTKSAFIKKAEGTDSSTGPVFRFISGPMVKVLDAISLGDNILMIAGKN